jgi:hypothetical protein
LGKEFRSSGVQELQEFRTIGRVKKTQNVRKSEFRSSGGAIPMDGAK